MLALLRYLLYEQECEVHSHKVGVFSYAKYPVINERCAIQPSAQYLARRAYIKPHTCVRYTAMQNNLLLGQ